MVSPGVRPGISIRPFSSVTYSPLALPTKAPLESVTRNVTPFSGSGQADRQTPGWCGVPGHRRQWELRSGREWTHLLHFARIVGVVRAIIRSDRLAAAVHHLKRNARQGFVGGTVDELPDGKRGIKTVDGFVLDGTPQTIEIKAGDGQQLPAGVRWRYR